MPFKTFNDSLPLPVLILQDRVTNILLWVPLRRLQGVDLKSFSKVGPKKAAWRQQFLLTTSSTSIQIVTQDHETLSHKTAAVAVHSQLHC